MSIHKMRYIQHFNSVPSVGLTRMTGQAGFSAAESFIEIAVAEVIAFYLYSVLIGAIKAANSTANGTPFTGSTGLLVGLVTVFYILAAALLPIGVLKYNLRRTH